MNKKYNYFLVMILHVLIFLLISCKPKDPEPKPQYKLSAGNTIGSGEVKIEPFVFPTIVEEDEKALFIIGVETDSSNFLGWYREDNGSLVLESEMQIYSIEQVKSDTVLYPRVELKTYQLLICENIDGIQSPSISINVEHGIETPIYADAYEGYEFAGWSTLDGGVIFQDANELNTTVILTEKDALIEAVFNRLQYQYNIGIATDGNGNGIIDNSISTQNGIYHYNDEIIAKAINDAGDSFVGWVDSKVDGQLITTMNPYIFNIIEDTMLFAKFTNTPIYSLNIVYGGNGNGRINLDPQPPYIQGENQVVTMTVSPNNNSEFTGWTDDTGLTEIIPNQEYTITMDGNKNYEANFTMKTFNVSVGNVLGNGDVTNNPTVNVSTVNYGGAAVFNIGINEQTSQFIGWFNTPNASNNAESTNKQYIKNNITQDITLYPKVDIKQLQLTVEASPNRGGTTQPSGSITANLGSPISISASPNSGYSFKNWTTEGNGIVIGNINSNNTNATLNTGSAKAIANFFPTIICATWLTTAKYLPGYDITVGDTYADTPLRATYNNDGTWNLKAQKLGSWWDGADGTYTTNGVNLIMNYVHITSDSFPFNSHLIENGDPEYGIYSYSIDSTRLGLGVFVGGNPTTLIGNWFASWSIKIKGNSTINKKELSLTLNSNNSYVYVIKNINYNGNSGTITETGIWSKTSNKLTLTPDGGSATVYDYVVIDDGLLFSTDLGYYNKQ